jgi:hypothetical protein
LTNHGRRTRSASRRDKRHDDRERREDDDDRGWRGGDEGSLQQLHGCEDGVEHTAAMPTTEAAPRDDEPARTNDRPEESSTRTNGDDDNEHWRGSVEGEARPRATLPLRCRRWWWRSEPMSRGGGRGGRRDAGDEEDGEDGAGDSSLRTKQRGSRRRGRHCNIDEGDGDVGRRTGDAAEAAGGRTVATTPLLPAGAHLLGSPRETEGRPGERRLLRRRGR